MSRTAAASVFVSLQRDKPWLKEFSRLPRFSRLKIRVWYLDIRQYWDSNDELSLKQNFTVLRHLKQPFARRQKNCFAACNRLNWPWGCSQKGIKMENFMKNRIALGLCVVLSAGFISVRAADTPAQAAARVALEQKLNHPDDSPTQSLPATNTLSEAAVEQPAKSAATVAETVPEKAVTPQTAPVATTPVAAPAAVSPAAVAPTAVGSCRVVPLRLLLRCRSRCGRSCRCQSCCGCSYHDVPDTVAPVFIASVNHRF